MMCYLITRIYFKYINLLFKVRYLIMVNTNNDVRIHILRVTTTCHNITNLLHAISTSSIYFNATYS